MMLLSTQPALSVDSAPLLSTLVQSGAALVAIVGGLLAARLVALVSERVALERRIRELSELDELRKKDLVVTRQAILDDEGEDFIYAVLEDYFDNPERTLESFFSEHGSDEVTVDEMRAYFEKFVARVADLMERLDCVNLAEGNRPEDWDDRRIALIERVQGQLPKTIAKEILDRAEQEWSSRKERRSSFGLLDPINYSGLITPPAIRAANFTSTATHRRDLRKNEASAEAAKAATALELAQARKALSLLSKPEGLGVAFTVLVGIAIAGVVLPLVQLTIGAMGLSMLLKIMYVSAFIASLIAFFAFLGHEIRRIMKAPSGE